MRNWREYLIEAWALGMFMLSACVFGALIEHPSSPVRAAIEDPLIRRALGGVAMGLTAIGLICSPWGQRSGAHMNPAVTLTYFLLGKIQPRDAAFYVAAQFAGGIAGMAAAGALIGGAIGHMSVNYAVTQPGPWGEGVAFVAEVLISATLISVLLAVSNSKTLSRYTPFFAGAMVALFIIVEQPYSGMSMNPARTFGSAAYAREWVSLWVYFTAPPLGMLIGAGAYRFGMGARRVFCAKLHHHNRERCIFRCEFGELNAGQ